MLEKVKYNNITNISTMPSGCKFCSHGHCMNQYANFHCKYEDERRKWLDTQKQEIEISPEDLEELKRIVEENCIIKKKLH